MPHVTRPDGARIHYETSGSGYPLLLFAPGGVSSEIVWWERSAINPIKEFAGDFTVIAMDQRHAGRSIGPAAPAGYDVAVGDQLAVLDDLGLERAHVMGGCIGVAYALRIIRDAPARISAAVGQDPVGIDATNSIDVFTAMFRPTLDLARREGMRPVVAAAQKDATFMLNNAAGPFSQRIHDDPAFREQILDMSVEEYVGVVESYSDQLWPDAAPLFSVSEAWLRTCPAPLLILPGNDPFHPTGIGRLLCELAPNARCLDVDARSPEKRGGTIEAIRAFLQEHAH